MKIPSLILKQLYNLGSLENEVEGVSFGLKNRLSDAILTRIREIKIDDREVPLRIENNNFERKRRLLAWIYLVHSGWR